MSRLDFSALQAESNMELRAHTGVEGELERASQFRVGQSAATWWSGFHSLISLFAQHIHSGAKMSVYLTPCCADISATAQSLQGKSALVFF